MPDRSPAAIAYGDGTQSGLEKKALKGLRGVKELVFCAPSALPKIAFAFHLGLLLRQRAYLLVVQLIDYLHNRFGFATPPVDCIQRATHSEVMGKSRIPDLAFNMP